MIIIQIAGGLGNQMQQYSLYRKLVEMGKEVKLDLSWFAEDIQKNMLAKREFELSLFEGLPYEICTDEERERFLKQGLLSKVIGKIFKKLGIWESSNPKVFEESKMYHDEIFDLDDKYITGYFACQKYYGDIMPGLRKLFVFPKSENAELEKKNSELAKKMDDENSVSVHIRRGDYLDPSNFAILGNIATDEYYKGAMEYFEKKYPDVHFYIFTSDHEYAREHYSDESKYTLVDWNTGKDSMYDLMLMSHCKGNICANSTFSFWGARLSDRQDHEVIRTYKMRNNQPVTPEIMHDYWKDWILMDNKGNIV
ncbi:alpha-1,2-fucosyltransferase [Butyrivibrio sp. XB500-5]|uniref:alpha-1,2-fucosyltransferase n=1 Tax=Butyrivibrio sp. XB500-5 TaxID=2364880 RepID=UPI000EA96AF3|nr:alpha-1,2-fucosyltransferase [Butyrivibrio sp. XB500-5]RKM59611.1 alpha-1,2-fucosyltransferase [Butyrivibrio sp. XB500-5]